MTFDRGLSDCFVDAFNKGYDNEVWWKKFVDDKETFLAIRKDEVHIYHLSLRLIELKLSGDKLIGWTHYKYLVQPNAKPKYVEIGEDGSPQYRSDYLIEQCTVDELKKAATPYATDEGKGVHQIVLHNSNVVDVEVAISTDDRTPRIDLAALQRDEEGCIHVVFYEAKHFESGRGDLRTEGGGKPKVIEQIVRYRDALTTHRVPIESSYQRVAENLSRLHGVERHCLPEKPGDLIIDDEPGLLVFGFDADQRDGSNWKPHERKLKKELGERLILSGNPERLSIPKAY